MALETQSPTGCRLFLLAEIQSVTNNFDDELVIGHGGFGKVFIGRISSEEGGQVVAIKRLDSMSNQGEVEFKAEIDMLSTLCHCHLVSLIGYCHENKEMILVYEYMTNGTLDHHLHKAHTPLSWLTRLKIAIGAALGLDYLHNGGVIHRDVKSSNILLDDNWVAMISDFGLSKVCPTNKSISFVEASVKGTFGYLDPEYFYTKKLTRKTDVYAFGVVLFELLSGRLPVDERLEEDECSLVRWAQKYVKERKLDQIVDSNIKGTIFPKCLKQYAQIAYHCLHSVPKERPTMTKVVFSLQAILELHEKINSSADSSGIMSFPWKMHSYFSSNSGTIEAAKTKTQAKQNNQHKKGIKEFTYDELKLATGDFENRIYFYEKYYFRTKLNYPAYAMVYEGWPALEMLKNFRHPNVLQIIGYSLQRGCSFLVYEFKSKWNIEDLLDSGAVAQLPLVTKVKMIVGIARGIVFLQKLELNIFWSELDRRMILLDEEYTAKISCYDCFYRNIARPGSLKFTSNLSGYEVIFAEVLTGERIYSSSRAKNLDRLFSQGGKKPVDSIARLCFKMCNDVDAEAKILKMLKERENLINSQIDQLAWQFL